MHTIMPYFGILVMPHFAHGHASLCARSCLIMRTVMPHYAYGYASLYTQSCLIMRTVMPLIMRTVMPHYAHNHASLCTQSCLIMRTVMPHYASLCALARLIMRTVMPHYAHSHASLCTSLSSVSGADKASACSKLMPYLCLLSELCKNRGVGVCSKRGLRHGGRQFCCCHFRGTAS